MSILCLETALTDTQHQVPHTTLRITINDLLEHHLRITAHLKSKIRPGGISHVENGCEETISSCQNESHPDYCQWTGWLISLGSIQHTV